MGSSVYLCNTDKLGKPEPEKKTKHNVNAKQLLEPNEGIMKSD